MIDVRDDHKVDIQAFARLRARCAFSVKPPEFLAALIAGSRWIAHAYDPAADGRLVGFARAISDGVATAYLSTVMVDPDYRRRGLGRALVQRLMRGRDEVKFVLHSRQDAADFYAAIEFVPAADLHGGRLSPSCVLSELRSGVSRDLSGPRARSLEMRCSACE